MTHNPEHLHVSFLVFFKLPKLAFFVLFLMQTVASQMNYDANLNLPTVCIIKNDVTEKFLIDSQYKNLANTNNSMISCVARFG